MDDLTKAKSVIEAYLLQTFNADPDRLHCYSTALLARLAQVGLWVVDSQKVKEEV
jgi:hypothetical protein